MKLVPILLEGSTFPAKVILFFSPLSLSSGFMGKRSGTQSSIVEGISNNQRIPGPGNEIIVLVKEGRDKGSWNDPRGRTLLYVRHCCSVIALNSNVTLAVTEVRTPP